MKMKEKSVTNRMQGFITKIFLISALILPVLTTKAKNPEIDGYYSEFILDNAIALGLMVMVLIAVIVNRKWNKRFAAGAVMLIVVLITYNVLYSQNMDIIQFRWGQWNTTISCALLIVLLVGNTKEFFDSEKIIPFAMVSIIITNLLGLVVYYKGYLSMHMYNFKLVFTRIDPNYYEKRFNWIYFYKCQYSCILLLFVAFFVANRKKFKHVLLYILSLAVLFFCLYIAHTNTSTVGALMIVAADCLDLFLENKKHILLKICGLASIAAVGIKYILIRIGRERDLSSLGARLPIWKAATQKIKENPQGLGNKFVLDYSQWLFIADTWKTNNCHNIFLNEMLRYSIPVGCSYLAYFLIICVYSLVKKFTFARLATWIAFFIAICMDYSIQTPELPMAMFMMYCIFFYPIESMDR